MYKWSVFLAVFTLLASAQPGVAGKPKVLNQRTEVSPDVQLLIIAARTKALVAGKTESKAGSTAPDTNGCQDVRIGNVSTDRFSAGSSHSTPENVVVTAPVINICSQY